jgi:streptogramin lyase
MPYRKEGTLASWLRQRKSAASLTPTEVAPLLQQAAEALQHAHSQQVIHQDIKPTNFLIRLRLEQPERPDLLLADFGIAKLSSSTASASQNIRGTPTYMAPEQWDGHPVPATDQYALAIMVYELLAGRPPFQGGPGQVMRQHYLASPPAVSTLNPGLSPAIDAVLLRALSKQPEQRFPSVTAFAQAFQEAAQTRSSADLHATLAISRTEAQSGTMRQLTLPGGQQISVTVPAGVLHGAILRLEGRGQPSVAGGLPGVLVLTISIRAAAEPSQLAQPGSAEPTAPGFAPYSPAPFAVDTRMPIARPDAPASPGASTLPPRPGELAPTLPTTNPSALPTPMPYSLMPFPVQPGAERVVAPAKSSNSRRFILPGLVVLIVVFASSGIWLAAHRATPVGSAHLSPTKTPHLSPAGIMTEFLLPAQPSPEGITQGPDGNLWFTETHSNQIGRITPGGAITEFPTPTGSSDPSVITEGPDGNLWFTEFNSNQIGRITPGGTITEFPTPTRDSGPFVIAKGPDNNLWFTETHGNKIGRITPGGIMTEFPIPTANSWPIGITAGPGGSLWFAEYDGQKIGRISSSGGTITEFPLQSQPYRITAGPDGNLWFTEAGSDSLWHISPNGVIAGIPLSTSDNKPYGITVGPDGNLWFVEENSDKIGRITPGGSITEFSIPTNKAFPFDIATGPDGNLWFSELDGNKIGRITSGKS